MIQPIACASLQILLFYDLHFLAQLSWQNSVFSNTTDARSQHFPSYLRLDTDLINFDLRVDFRCYFVHGLKLEKESGAAFARGDSASE